MFNTRKNVRSRKEEKEEEKNDVVKWEYVFDQMERMKRAEKREIGRNRVDKEKKQNKITEKIKKWHKVFYIIQRKQMLNTF